MKVEALPCGHIEIDGVSHDDVVIDRGRIRKRETTRDSAHQAPQPEERMSAPADTLSEMALVEIRNLHVISGDGHAQRRPSADPTEREPSVHAQAVPCDTVADAMTRGTLKVPEEAPVAKAAATMAVRGIHRVLAVSDDGRVVGILTTGDVARWVAQLAGHLPPSA
jgi:hypothetical protein